MNEDGTMSRVPQLHEFCRQHDLKMLTVADLIRYRMQHERYVRRVAEAVLPTRYGDFRMIAYSSDVDHDQHVALVRGDLEGANSGARPRPLALPDRRRLRLHHLRLLRTGLALADRHRQGRPRRLSLSPSHRPRLRHRNARSTRRPARKSISTSAASSIANPPASAWSSTKAASARKS